MRVIKLILILTFLTTCICGQGQENYFKVDNLTKDSIPSDTLIKGKFIEGKRWTDRNGENLLIVSEIGPKIIYWTNGRPYMWKAIFNINRYIKQNQIFQLYCHYNDTIEDIWMIPTWASLLFNSTTVTDLDSNGIAETTHIFCHKFSSDVQPPNMKLVFNDGSKNCVLDGQMYFKLTCEGCLIKSITDTTNMNKFEYDCEKLYTSKGLKYNSQNAYDNHLSIGRFQNSHDFDSLPPVFIDFARKIWGTNMTKYVDYELMYLYGSDFTW